MWLFCLSTCCLLSAFLYTPVPANTVVNKEDWGSQGMDDPFAERHLPDVIRPGMKEHDLTVPLPGSAPYHLLPMFQAARAPLIDKQLFRPSVGERPLPNSVKNLLLPPPYSPLGNPMSPARNPKGVEVWCGDTKLSVQVNRRMLGFWTLPSMLYLGSCSVYRFTNEYYYFHNNLTQCGSTQTTVNGRLVYSNTLHYIPEQHGPVVRAVPLSLPIHCIYDRFHYSYKVGYVPGLEKNTFLKSLWSERRFRLTACNAHWEKLASTESYVLSEPMYFEATAAFVSRNEMIFVTSCHVTLSKDPNSTPRLDVIENFGCLTDSKREGSRSRFYHYRPDVLRFTIDAFVFPKITSKLLYLHCTISVGQSLASPRAKSCTFNWETRRWEELYSAASVCSCCDSQCGRNPFWPSSLSPSPRALITSDPWRVINGVPNGPLEADRGEEPGEEPLLVEDGEGEGFGAESVETKARSVKGGLEADRDPEEAQDSQEEQESVEEEEGEPVVWREEDQRPDQDEEARRKMKTRMVTPME